MTTCRRVYDHRIRVLAADRNCDPGLLDALQLPRSTVSSWRTRGTREVVTLPDADSDLFGLREENQRLRARLLRTERCLAIALAVARLLTVLVKLAEARLDSDRLPDGAAKASVLTAITRASIGLPLGAALRTVGLSGSRYHAWQRAGKLCVLDDRQSCPKSHPTQLTPEEVATMKEMVHDPELRHMPLGTLAVYAQRIKKVFANPQTWSRISLARGWKRPHIRLYPEKPKIGIRASAPNQYWHIDVTLLRLLDGSRVYLHAVIDNYSRRILGWHADSKLSPEGTCAILLEAAKNLKPGDAQPAFVCDSGIENLNGPIDELLKTGLLTRIFAQVDVPWSNSLIGSWWKSLKYRWLFVNPLTRAAGGCMQDDACLVEISRKLNADLIVNGSVGKVGTSYVLTLGTLKPADMKSNRRASETSETAQDLIKALPGCLDKLFHWGKATTAIFHLPKGRNLSFAVFDLKPTGLSPETAANLTQVLTTEVKGIEGASVVSRDDITAMLQLESTKMKAGCDDASCMAEIGGALGVDRLITGDAGKVGTLYIVNLRLLDVRHGIVENRVTESFEGTEEQLLRAVRFAARNLLGLKAAAKGQLAITASQNAADVFVDDATSGKAPAHVVDLLPGKHTVRVATGGFFDWHGDVYVDPLETTSIWAEMNARPQAWYQRWWVWTIVGGAVAAATATAVVETQKPPKTGGGTVYAP